ncbi:MAG: DUF2752 domain-containing protein [Winogradskyella sp.]|uniref:DUF2752 domain-containing protein n=1 Tax=Winogradskyella sp. TaxID=1883156 RepID=UPI000F3E82DF|nr:MAG: DUF2752 domain-containing protein [Winogradskyella sp.]
MLADIKNFIKYKYLKYGYLLLAIPIFFLVKYYYLNDPEVAKGEGLFPRCPFHSITGLHCPGCGSQRATHDLLHLRIGEALMHNIVIVIIAILLLSKLYAYITKRYNQKYYYNLSHKPYFTYAIVVVVFLYWILRNIPAYPFTELAP